MTPPKRGDPSPGKAFDVGLRRLPELDRDAPLPGSDPRLLARIAEEIRATGPMSFARFMELALYDPDGGYYTRDDDALDATSSTAGPGRRGDFLTAPESHPLFGWAVARHLESVWDAIDRPRRFVVREHGAGTGALALGILDGLRRSGSPLLGAIRYQPVDVAQHRLQALEARLAEAGLHQHLDVASDGPAAGAVLANELLDALPVHRVETGADGTLLERFVVLQGATGHAAGAERSGPPGRAVDSPGEPRLDTVLGPPSSPDLAERLAAEDVQLQPGQPAEICLAIDGWVAAAAARLERGELLVIDYGHPARDLYAPGRGSLLRAYHRHRVHDDPFVAIGRQDLTAHVDLTAVERAATAAGLEPVGRARQADFLAALGAGELLVGLQSDPETTFESYLAARSALVRMLDPRATGGFAVLAFGRGLAARVPLRGFDVS